MSEECNVLGSACALLTVVFVALKLDGAIHWHWMWVLSPLWLPWAVGLAFLLVVVVAAGFAAIFGK